MQVAFGIYKASGMGYNEAIKPGRYIGMKLRGNKAIVTGGSRGIGLAIAKELVQAGAIGG